MLDFHNRKRLNTLISIWEKVLEALKTAVLLLHHNNRAILYPNQPCLTQRLDSKEITQDSPPARHNQST